MDQNNSQNTQSPPENSDLAKQYQDILDRYADELAKNPPTTEVSPESASTDTSNPAMDLDSEQTIPAQITELTNPTENISDIPLEEPISTSDFQNQSLESNNPAEYTDIPLTEVPPAEVHVPPSSPEPPPPVYSNLPPVVITPPPTTPPANLPPSDISVINQPPRQSGGGFFKFLFVISVLTFLGVFGSIIYSMFGDKLTNPGNQPPAPPTPTVTTIGTCALNDKDYKVGESFASADGCNTCSCNPDLTISCTEMSCEVTPTKPSTPSATSIPSVP